MRDTERKLLVDEFNDPKSNLSVMIITYDIGSVGLNLHKACNMAVPAAPGNSWSQEAQAYGRCLRVTSMFNLKVDGSADKDYESIEIALNDTDHDEEKEKEDSTLDLSANLGNTSSRATRQIELDHAALESKFAWDQLSSVPKYDAQNRLELKLLKFPPRKVWCSADLHDPQHPEWFVVGIRLMYQQLRRDRMLNLAQSIHIRSSDISNAQKEQIDKIIQCPMDLDASAKATHVFKVWEREGLGQKGTELGTYGCQFQIYF
ncbi:Helicase C-terminal [Penicillium brevicompactum]|uniref:Helicase C-terminal n=1 Tax=Penicillium brevicompactum TaxID=5074 RepID=UPI002541FE08|nr:Helicase C-terminal [Penicillium brevicompactum]KAJ5326908.1 Helicase C-terminal [Penicillium brevicompactum]